MALTPLPSDFIITPNNSGNLGETNRTKTGALMNSLQPVSPIMTGLDLLSGYILNQKEESRNNQSFKSFYRNLNNQSPILDMNTRYGQKSYNTPIITAEEGALIRKNLKADAPVELEGGEVLLLPDGTLELTKGKKHKDGGVRTDLPVGTFIFSNKLKPEGSKSTFAELAKKEDYTKHINILNDPTSNKTERETATLMLERKTKALKELMSTQQDMNGDSSGEQSKFSNGGIIKFDGGGYVNPIVQMYLDSGMTDPKKFMETLPKNSFMVSSGLLGPEDSSYINGYRGWGNYDHLKQKTVFDNTGYKTPFNTSDGNQFGFYGFDRLFKENPEELINLLKHTPSLSNNNKNDDAADRYNEELINKISERYNTDPERFKAQLDLISKKYTKEIETCLSGNCADLGYAINNYSSVINKINEQDFNNFSKDPNLLATAAQEASDKIKKGQLERNPYFPPPSKGIKAQSISLPTLKDTPIDIDSFKQNWETKLSLLKNSLNRPSDPSFPVVKNGKDMSDENYGKWNPQLVINGVNDLLDRFTYKDGRIDFELLNKELQSPESAFYKTNKFTPQEAKVISSTIQADATKAPDIIFSSVAAQTGGIPLGEWKQSLQSPEKLQTFIDNNMPFTSNSESWKAVEKELGIKQPAYDDLTDEATLTKKAASLQKWYNKAVELGFTPSTGTPDFVAIAKAGKQGQEVMDSIAGDLQSFLVRQTPETVDAYMKSVDPTNKFRQDPNAPFKGFEDKRWWYRAPQYRDVIFDTQDEYDRYINSKQSFNVDGKTYFQDTTNPDFFINPSVKKVDNNSTLPSGGKSNGGTNPNGITIDSTITDKTKPGYKKQPYPLLNAVGDTIPYLNSLNTFPYQTPDYTHWEVSPAKLDIQSQLNDITNSTNAFAKYSSGNPSIRNSRNNSLYASMLAAKNQVYQNKQNYDANAAYQADVQNNNARTVEQTLDTQAWTHVYNDQYSLAKDNAGTERTYAITNAINNQQKHRSNEALKKLYLDNFFPNITSEDGKSINFTPSDHAFVAPTLFNQILKNK